MAGEQQQIQTVYELAESLQSFFNSTVTAGVKLNTNKCNYLKEAFGTYGRYLISHATLF